VTEVATETPVAPEAPAAPTAPVETPAAPSLVDDVPAAPAEAPAAAPSLVPDPPAEDAEAKWYLSEGVAGDGEVPEWFKSDKYKTVDEQAKAYQELEKRFGAFTGAPKDGVYKINMPEGLVGEFDTDNQLFQDLNKWATDSQLSQDKYDDVIGMLARYEASVQPDLNEIKKELGENADARLTSAAQWAKSNLSEGEYNAFRNAQTERNAADVFTAFEAIINKTREVSLPKPGDDVPGLQTGGLERINEMRAKLGEDGRRLYETDDKYRAEVEAANLAYWKSQEKR